MLPQDISNATKEYKNNSTRILVSILITAIMFMVGAYTKLALRDNGRSDKDADKCDEEKKELKQEIAELKVDKDSLTREIKYLWIDKVEAQKVFKNSLKDILKEKK